jgi:hypothetical protein
MFDSNGYVGIYRGALKLPVTVGYWNFILGKYQRIMLALHSERKKGGSGIRFADSDDLSVAKGSLLFVSSTSSSIFSGFFRALSSSPRSSAKKTRNSCGYWARNR